jgi:hypothetical protein
VKKIIAVLTAFIVAACALPETTVKTGSLRPHLAVKGAPADAVLIVDGLSMGAASQFDGNPNVLAVEEGVHLVEIRRAGKAVHSEKAFVSNGETKVIHVHAGAQ